jgi:hypothetical protein
MNFSRDSRQTKKTSVESIYWQIIGLRFLLWTSWLLSRDGYDHRSAPTEENEPEAF